MKLAIPKKDFKQSLASVMKTVTTRSTLPILNNIYIRTRENEIFMNSTNLECYTEVNLPASVEETGEITLPARLLLDVANAVGSARSENIMLESNDGKSAKVNAEPYNYVINGIEAEEYKEYLPDFTPSFTIELSGEKLSEMMNMAKVAVATDESRPSLMGTRVEISKKLMRMVATDSRRLVVTDTELKSEVDGEHSFIIPGKALNDLTGMIDSGREVVLQINENCNLVSFEFSNMKFYSRLLDGEFPDYESVIPAETAIEIKINRNTLKEGLEGILPIAKGNAGIVKVFLKDALLTLEAVSSETGIAKIDLQCEKTGGDLEISFNARYLIEALNSVSVDEVSLGFNKSLTPCIIKPVKGDGFIWVVMPIRPA